MAYPNPRTTPALVMGLIETQAGISLDPFIATANAIVTNVCSKSGYADTGVGSLMELIERWLSAHFYTVFDNQLTAAKAGTVQVRYQYKVDYFFRTSMYGQQAMMLDFMGNLAALENTAGTKRQITLQLLNLGRRRCHSWYGDWWADLTTEQ